jgi:hypothetical protein
MGLDYTAACMKFFFVLFLWVCMAAVLATGVVMATHGSFWLLIVALLCFIAGLIKYGIFSH